VVSVSNIKYIENDDFNCCTARCVQLAWQLHDRFGKLIQSGDHIIKPLNFEIPLTSTKIHGITNEMANQKGIDIQEVFSKFNKALEDTTFLIGHNLEFDINVISSEYYRLNENINLDEFKVIDTMKTTIDYCKLRLGKEGVVSLVEPIGRFN
jgi:DNA polymerase-3 subunit alpha